MVILTGYVIIPEEDLSAFQEAIVEHVRLTLAEPGCLNFTITPDAKDRCKFSIYEEFIDQAAFDHHQTRTARSDWAKITTNMQRFYSLMETD